ncbi:MAG: hypothetical protein O7A68_06040, partial [Alphaproteobacteria bacterium]|nr:hypothetical protein [Alphaproteobacteria bacterium]
RSRTWVHLGKGLRFSECLSVELKIPLAAAAWAAPGAASAMIPAITGASIRRPRRSRDPPPGALSREILIMLSIPSIKPMIEIP